MNNLPPASSTVNNIYGSIGNSSERFIDNEFCYSVKASSHTWIGLSSLVPSNILATSLKQSLHPGWRRQEVMVMGDIRVAVITCPPSYFR